MIDSLSQPVRRFAAIALLFVLFFAVWDLFINPTLSVFEESRQETSRLVRLREAYEELIQNRPVYETMRRKMLSKDYISHFIDENDPNLGSAKFQSLVQHLIEAVGGSVKSIQVLPLTKEAELQRVNVRVSFSLPLGNLVPLLMRAKQQSPYTFLDHVVMTSPDTVQSNDKKPVLLQINCDFHAYLKPVSS
jgi:Type II secretion system (T2SS), protein M subtype b